MARRIFALTRARPIVRMKRPMLAFCSAKTCSLPAHLRERAALARARGRGMALFGGLRKRDLRDQPCGGNAVLVYQLYQPSLGPESETRPASGSASVWTVFMVVPKQLIAMRRDLDALGSGYLARIFRLRWQPSTAGSR